jgi:hypothetical protein
MPPELMNSPGLHRVVNMLPNRNAVAILPQAPAYEAVPLSVDDKRLLVRELTLTVLICSGNCELRL